MIRRGHDESFVPAHKRTRKKAGAQLASRSDALKARALRAYVQIATVRGACRAARIGRRTWYDWIESDPTFGEQVLDAHEEVADELEAEAFKRALHGSDTLLIFLLKARRPAKYRDKYTVTVHAPEVQVALRSSIELIASRPIWDSQELLDRMEGIWK